ncbi:zinc-ribbon domain containing protein [Candidatus Uhrbacteria bacterium]|nr:zinc-ribbon domain containing protein [Candidatus Uhrbacteria bacterium]
MSQKLTCEKCSKPFLVIDQEEKFLKEHNWPLPTECPDCRQARRMAMRNPRKLYKTKCDKCDKDIIVTFERKPGEVVYCKEHYLEWYESSNHLVE